MTLPNTTAGASELRISLNVRMTPKQRHELRILAAQRDMSMSGFVMRAVDLAVARAERGKE
jgi:uncharacterized protein (DUF1778 family)